MKDETKRTQMWKLSINKKENNEEGKTEKWKKGRSSKRWTTTTYR